MIWIRILTMQHCLHNVEVRVLDVCVVIVMHLATKYNWNFIETLSVRKYVWNHINEYRRNGIHSCFWWFWSCKFNRINHLSYNKRRKYKFHAIQRSHTRARWMSAMGVLRAIIAIILWTLKSLHIFHISMWLSEQCCTRTQRSYVVIAVICSI